MDLDCGVHNQSTHIVDVHTDSDTVSSSSARQATGSCPAATIRIYVLAPAFLCVSLRFSAFLCVSLRFSAFLCVLRGKISRGAIQLPPTSGAGPLAKRLLELLSLNR